jgi:hypothetical protein
MIKMSKNNPRLKIRGETVKALSGLEMAGIRGGVDVPQWTGSKANCCNDPD